MRVVAGKYRGKSIQSPQDKSVRPTSDRIKETIFNIIQFDVQDASVLDLFGGSGALGIEAVSRGAKEVVFVDKAKDSIILIKKNLVGISEDCKVIPCDFLTALRTFHRKFNIIFIDPPYDSKLGDLAIEAIIDLDILEDNGIIVYEHSSNKDYKLDRNGFKIRTKQMGSISCEFISKKTVGLVTGSFDPITKGHEIVIDTALERFDEVWCAVLVNDEKTYFFTDEERVQLVEKTIEDKKNCNAIFSKETACEVAKKVGATKLVRGIRGEDDLAYENLMAENNKKFGFETEFIKVDDFNGISSTRVKDEILAGNFKSVPPRTIFDIMEILDDKKTK